ncbi:MAG: hypothetical protein HYY84_03105 [Deltaproteobacteria bacterium]|nr:hypothetical protein [Deltaproteobacteria bacterium]
MAGRNRRLTSARSFAQVWGLGAAILIAIAAPWGSARGAVMVPLDLKQLIVGAERIVHGKVIATEMYWLGGRIVTDAKVLVDKTMKGSVEKLIVVRRLGGVVDGIGQKTWGSATLDLGEEIFVFLEQRNQSGVWHPVGMAQGKFSVTKDAAGEKRVARDVREIAFRRAEPGPLNVDRHGVISAVRRLSELMKDVEAHLKGTR